MQSTRPQEMGDGRKVTKFNKVNKYLFYKMELKRVETQAWWNAKLSWNTCIVKPSQYLHPRNMWFVVQIMGWVWKELAQVWLKVCPHEGQFYGRVASTTEMCPRGANIFRGSGNNVKSKGAASACPAIALCVDMSLVSQCSLLWMC